MKKNRETNTTKKQPERARAIPSTELGTVTGASCGFQEYRPTWWEKFQEYGWVP